MHLGQGHTSFSRDSESIIKSEHHFPINGYKNRTKKSPHIEFKFTITPIQTTKRFYTTQYPRFKMSSIKNVLVVGVSLTDSMSSRLGFTD